jgi:nitroreductase
MEFSEIVMKRYAVKKFDGRKVPEEKVRQLEDIIRYSASSFGLQPWKVKMVTDQATKDKLMAASWNQPQVGTASHVLVLCADSDVNALITKLEAALVKAGSSKESLKGYVDVMRGFAEGKDEAARLAWAQKQVYIALGNALNGAKSLGFDSCPMEGFDPAQYSRILNLPKNIVPTVVCPIGYAADTPRPKVRFERKEVFF